MRYGEDNYENNFLDDFSGYGGYGGLPATTYTAPVTTYTPPAATYTPPMGGLSDYYADYAAKNPDWLNSTTSPEAIAAGKDLMKNASDYYASKQEMYPGYGSQYIGTDNMLPGISTPGDLLTGMFGGLSPLDPLYNYAKTAPILSLKGNKEYENLNFQALPDTNYRLTVGGQVVGSASNPQEVAALVNQANAISESGGAKVDVRLQKEVQAATPTGDPYTAFNDVYANRENNTGALSTLIPLALTAMGVGALGPLIQSGAVGTAAAGKATALGMGLGGGAGQFAGQLGTGASVEDALKKAALTAAAIYGMQATGVNDAIGSALSGKSAAASKLGGFTPIPGAGGMTPIPADAFSGLAQSAVDNIPTVLGSRIAQSAIPKLASAAIGAGAGALATAAPRPYEPQPGDEPVLTSSTPRPVPTNVPPIVPAAASDAIRNIVGAQELLGNQPATPEEEIDVTGRRIEDVTTGPLASLPAPVVSDLVTKYKPPEPVESLIEKQAKKIDDADEITVTAKPIEATGSLGAALPGLAMTLPAMTAAQAISPTAATPAAKKGMSTYGKITGGLAILDALGNLLGGGGGGGGAGAGGATGLDALAPTFRAQLPTPRGQFTPQALGQRPPGEAGRPAIDYARYGYGPARSFFNYVPETQAERDAFAATAAAPAAPRVGVGTVMPQALPGAAQTGATDSVLRAGFEKLRAAVPGASDAELVAFLGTPEGQQELAMIFEGLGATTRAKGGSMGGKGQSRESFAVNGAGTGRSDEIPALLSDGEYVIDAETVALLGDGSGKAGAQRLDEFRAKIRKHKGRNLAKGKFSVNAKRPERYLSGGLV